MQTRVLWTQLGQIPRKSVHVLKNCAPGSLSPEMPKPVWDLEWFCTKVCKIFPLFENLSKGFKILKMSVISSLLLLLKLLNKDCMIYQAQFIEAFLCFFVIQIIRDLFLLHFATQWPISLKTLNKADLMLDMGNQTSSCVDTFWKDLSCEYTSKVSLK